MKTLWIIVGLALIGGGYGYWEWSRAEANQLSAPPATVTVETGTVERSVLASGVIEAGNLVSVGARVSGLIETLAVDLGDKVAQGDPIAQIESLDQQSPNSAFGHWPVRSDRYLAHTADVQKRSPPPPAKSSEDLVV